jgi:predicted phosphohydrolase
MTLRGAISGGAGLERRRMRADALASPDAIPAGKGVFAVVGDLQPTSGLEVWRESNQAERKLIIREIARDAPDFVAMLGDLVFCGSSGAAWSDFDRLCAPLRSEKVLSMPVLGNHEYWLTRRPALANFFQRFPHLEGRHWYAARYGPLGLVFLDSNVHWLPPPQWRAQLDWYEQQLAAFDAAPDVKGTLVLLHHPPFTNSRVTSDTLHVQKEIVPLFQLAGKTLAMLSGHVHSYERFERAGKTFLVTGGGGGPRAQLSQGTRRRHSDDVFEGPALRLFHYLRMRLRSEGVEVEVRSLEKRGEHFDTMERFTLGWPPAGAEPGS